MQVAPFLNSTPLPTDEAHPPPTHTPHTFPHHILQQAPTRRTGNRQHHPTRSAAHRGERAVLLCRLHRNLRLPRPRHQAHHLRCSHGRRHSHGWRLNRRHPQRPRQSHHTPGQRRQHTYSPDSRPPPMAHHQPQLTHPAATKPQGQDYWHHTQLCPRLLCRPDTP